LTNEYTPMGMTALMDAIGKTINGIGENLSKTDEADRPEKVIFVILTDGGENASKEFVVSKVKKMIEHQRSKYSWQFVFLAQNIDACEMSNNLGTGNSGYSGATGTSGYSGCASVISACVTNYRSTGDIGDALDVTK
jgi:hypothetical protein